MCDDDSKCEMSLMEWFVYPLASYVLWQIFYLFVTELVCRKHIEQNPDVSTSMRWLSADRKNGFNKFCKMVRLYIYFFLQTNFQTIAQQICRKIGVLKPQEEFDGDTTKTKIVFVTVQFLYTILTYVVFERGVREYFSLMFIQSCHSPQHSFRTRIVTTQPRNTLLLGKP